MGELMPVGGCAEEESVVLAALGKAPAGTGLFCEGGYNQGGGVNSWDGGRGRGGCSRGCNT